MKVPRFVREYANYIEREYLDGFSADIENLLSLYTLGRITVLDAMSKLTEIERAYKYESED